MKKVQLMLPFGKHMRKERSVQGVVEREMTIHGRWQLVTSLLSINGRVVRSATYFSALIGTTGRAQLTGELDAAIVPGRDRRCRRRCVSWPGARLRSANTGRRPRSRGSDGGRSPRRGCCATAAASAGRNDEHRRYLGLLFGSV